jgi:plastocyanin
MANSASADPGPDETVGTIRGTIRFTGKVPPPTEFTTTDGRTLKHYDLVVDARTRGLRDVVVVLADAPAQPKAEKAEPVVMDQRDMLFVPRVVAVRHGQAVRFENSDLFNHSVMTASPVQDDQFNVFVLPGRPLEHVFALQKHPVQIGCSLHAWMRAWIFVVPHPWFAVSDAKGAFTIEKIPPGKYTLWLCHPDTGQQERRTVDVEPERTTELTIVWRTTGK